MKTRKPPALFTRVDEKLIGQSGVVDVVYGGREERGRDFQRCENALKTRQINKFPCTRALVGKGKKTRF